MKLLIPFILLMTLSLRVLATDSEGSQPTKTTDESSYEDSSDSSDDTPVESDDVLIESSEEDSE